jgi:hypothetical protein
VIINLKISQDYFEATGKNRAFFDLHATFDYLYQYYIAIFGLIALILAFLSKKIDHRTSRLLTAVGLAIFSLILVFLNLWRLFAWIAE